MLLKPLLLMMAEVLLVSVHRQQPSSSSSFVADAFILDNNINININVNININININTNDFPRAMRRSSASSNGLLLHPATRASSSSSSSSSSPSSRSRNLHNLDDAVVNGVDESETTSALPPTTSQEEENDDSDDGEEGGQLKANRYEPETTTMFDLLAGAVTTCLLESDKRRDAKGPSNEKVVSSSATNWINDRQSFIVKQLLDQCEIKLPQDRTGINRDDASAFIRWMKATPIPTIVDLSTPFLRQVANSVMTDSDLELIDQTRTQFLDRMVCRIILLPSGTALSKPLWEPPASLVYGKLLFGGVTRYRRLVSTSSSSSSSSSSSQPKIRKAGERTEIKSTLSTRSTTWIQYGGTQRMYEGVDIGPACLLEVVLLPRGTAALRTATTSSNSPSRNSRRNNNDHDPTGDEHNDDDRTKERSEIRQDADMAIYNFGWPPQDIFEMVHQDDDDHSDGTERSQDKDGGSIYVRPSTLLQSVTIGYARLRLFVCHFVRSLIRSYSIL